MKQESNFPVLFQTGDFPFLSKLASNPEDFSSAKVGRLTLALLDSKPRSDNWQSNHRMDHSFDEVLFVSATGEVVGSVRCQTNGDEWTGETVGEAFLRLSSSAQSLVCYVLWMHTEDTRDEENVHEWWRSLVLYRPPSGFSLVDWALKQIERRQALIAHAQERIDREAQEDASFCLVSDNVPRDFREALRALTEKHGVYLI